MSAELFAAGVDSADAAAAAVREAARTAAQSERGAAGLAHAALFEEALLGALKARFAELKTVAR